MERTFLSEGDFSSVSFYLVAGFTAFCCLFALWAVRPSTSSILRKVSSKKSEGGGGGGARSSSKKKACGCTCSCGGGGGVPNSSPASAPYANGSAGEMHERAPVVAERQTGASMMEQLVPEITTHALSYLDYPSLCRLSMTNSLMRKAANDDSAWKALYHKDFTMEQDSVTPINGWKAYYAATRAVVNVNAEFYNIIREKSLQAMSRLWLHADYVKCIHGSGELFTGYNAVIESWQLAFRWGPWGQEVSFQIRDVRARVLTDMAWVTMKTYIGIDRGPFHVTNVYEFHNGRWYMVHHHSSVILDGEVEHQNMFG
ncbi:PREDICTED: F-box protein SKIP8 isoform X1 [Nelumbo nucifera]|uniref:F-box protein SKIP8 isoform X1 n=1 Tax=Nelumbo nucifera TaxID=4432 RepID=A0A1U8AWE9_NELNU|nr:PREDICTED: F-box protein SKIP8 isoform X1 [Nelumbo nucifera]XP_010267604.1 PREDICTED: F-box protein SKIP8 isoform X1 [Nelumbo nucifera]